jgi:hypothetical protein
VHPAHCAYGCFLVFSARPALIGRFALGSARDGRFRRRARAATRPIMK